MANEPEVKAILDYRATVQHNRETFLLARPWVERETGIAGRACRYHRQVIWKGLIKQNFGGNVID